MEVASSKILYANFWSLSMMVSVYEGAMKRTLTSVFKIVS